MTFSIEFQFSDISQWANDKLTTQNVKLIYSCRDVTITLKPSIEIPVSVQVQLPGTSVIRSWTESWLYFDTSNYRCVESFELAEAVSNTSLTLSLTADGDLDASDRNEFSSGSFKIKFNIFNTNTVQTSDTINFEITCTSSTDLN